jgi:putative ABC transport system permease protein
MVRLARVDLGFGNTQALALEVTLPQERYDSPARVIAFHRDAAERLRAVPGVRRVGATGVLPGDRALGVGLRVTPAALPADQADRIPFAIMLYASPDYFRAMGVRIVKGRAFTAADAAGAPPVMIVSESEAAAIWPDGRDPIGEIVTLGRATTFEVVGVVSDVRLRGPDTDSPVRQFYRSILQSPPFGPMVFVVDAGTPPLALVPAMRAALADVDPDLPMYNVQPVAAITTGFLAAHRLAMTLMGGFAAMTLLLAAVGLYGVLAQIVSQRTREIGIRIALGAGTARLLRGVVLHGLGLAAAGIALGAAAAGIAARLIRAFVPSLDALAWTTIAADAMVLLVVALVATWIPARRAASVDPLVSLRAD